MGALRNSVIGLEGVVQRLRSERDAFKEEVGQLRAELATCEEWLDALEAGLPEPSWLIASSPSLKTCVIGAKMTN